MPCLVCNECRAPTVECQHATAVSAGLQYRYTGTVYWQWLAGTGYICVLWNSNIHANRKLELRGVLTDWGGVKHIGHHAGLDTSKQEWAVVITILATPTTTLLQNSTMIPLLNTMCSWWQVGIKQIWNKHGHTHLSTHLNADFSFFFKITFVTNQQ